MKKWSFFSFNFHVAAAKSLQLCLTLCDPIDGSPPGSSVHGTLQARTLEWVAISFSRRSFRPRDWTHVCLLHWQASSLPLSHQGKKWLLLWTQLNVSYFTTNSYHYWAGILCLTLYQVLFLHWKWKWNLLSHVRLFTTPWTAHGILQARILVVIPFSTGSSQPRDWIQVSRIAGRFFTSRANREAL